MNERYQIEYIDEEIASIHDEFLGIEMTAEDVIEHLNKHLKENQKFKITLQESIKNERTTMGKSVLMQLADNLGVDYQ